MRRAVFAVLAALPLVAAAPAAAQAPERAPEAAARPDRFPLEAPASPPAPEAPRARPRPEAPPRSQALAEGRRLDPPRPAAGPAAPLAPLPAPRPDLAGASARLAALPPDPLAAPRGRPDRSPGARPLCGDPRLEGARIAAIRQGACGIERPVRLSAVAGARLTRPITVGCETAVELAGWVENVARPAARARLGAELVEITSFAGYACRSVNSRPGGSLSHHALGEAVDLGAFRLASGRSVAVTDWRAGDARAEFLRDLWEGACGPFGTVLGPGSDAYHQDHLHFDVAERRAAYCR